MRSGSSLWLSIWGVSSACSLLSCIFCAGLRRGIQWCIVFCRLVALRWRSVLGGIVIVAVDRPGAAALAAAGSARADPACVARLARVVLSRGAAAGLVSHGFFCSAFALLVLLVSLLFVTLCCVLGLLLFLCALSSASAFHFGAFPSAKDSGSWFAPDKECRSSRGWPSIAGLRMPS